VLSTVDDGTFWMSFDDMLKHFVSVNVCMTRHPGLNKSPWREVRRTFFYEYQTEAHDANNSVVSPLFVLTVTKPGKFIAAVHQNDIRIEGAIPYIDFGVTVMKANPVHGEFQLIGGTGNSTERQNQTEEFVLTPGKYVIVPTSTGCKLKEHMEEIERSRSKAGGPVPKLVEKDAKGEVDFTSETRRVYREIFERMDHDDDGQLSKTELDGFMMRTEGTAIDEKAFLWLLHNFESKDKIGLTLAGFIKAQLFVFKHTGGDEQKLWEEFKLLGYNANLEFTAGREATMSLHGTGEFFVETQPFDPNAYEEAMELPIIHAGTLQSFEDGKLGLYRFRSGYGGMSFVIKNNNIVPVTFNLDCSGSENVCSHRGDLAHQLTCPAGEAKVLHHLMPLDASNSRWTWAYSASFMWEDADDTA
jgi:Ca2+-binding EF-hand superfamily protein